MKTCCFLLLIALTVLALPGCGGTPAPQQGPAGDGPAQEIRPRRPAGGAAASEPVRAPVVNRQVTDEHGVTRTVTVPMSEAEAVFEKLSAPPTKMPLTKMPTQKGGGSGTPPERTPSPEKIGPEKLWRRPTEKTGNTGEPTKAPSDARRPDKTT